MRFLITFLLAPLFAITDQGAALATNNEVPFAAHRGDHASGLAEQSLEAQLSAIEKGAAWMDMDVRPSRDGGLFLHHDGGYVETHSSLWLRQHHVPTLSGVLAGTKQYLEVEAFVEIKSAQSDTYKRAVYLFKQFGIGRVIVSSYSRTVLNNYRKVYPKGRVSLNSVIQQKPDYYLKYQSASIDIDIATPTYVNALKDKGLPVYVFTPSSEDEWAKVPDNVDGIFTDNIDGYLEY